MDAQIACSLPRVKKCGRFSDGTAVWVREKAIVHHGLRKSLSQCAAFHDLMMP
jgi:hypothetical protein